MQQASLTPGHEFHNDRLHQVRQNSPGEEIGFSNNTSRPLEENACSHAHIYCANLYE